MNWVEAYKILKREQKKTFSGLRLHAGLLSNLPSSVEWSEYMLEHTDEVDAACAHFAAKRTWPNMNQKVAAIVFLRVLEAADFAEFVVCPKLVQKYPKQDTTVRGNLLLWLLVDYWKLAGIWRRIYQTR
jgi:hypothetical protein